MKYRNTTFAFVTTIKPDADAAGKLLEYRPQDCYNNQGKYQLHQYGKGSFCRFRIPAKFSEPGVYLIMTQETVLYIGRCQNLAQRFNAGYGQISPRNCYIKGRETNCRINQLILAAIKKGKKLDLYFHQTDDFCALEAQLLAARNPPWNLA